MSGSLDYSPPGFSVHGISQIRVVEQVAISFSRVSSQPRDQTHISVSAALACRFFTTELPRKPNSDDMGPFIFIWSIVDLQWCINFCCIAKWFSYAHIYLNILHILFCCDSSQDIEYSSLCYTVWLCYLSLIYILIASTNPKLPFLFSPTHPPHWQPQVCSLCHWVFFCFVDRFNCVIF